MKIKKTKVQDSRDKSFCFVLSLDKDLLKTLN